LRLSGRTAFSNQRKISAGTKRTPGPGKHHDANGLIGGDSADDIIQSGDEFGV
jgi:hypothetical protein